MNSNSRSSSSLFINKYQPLYFEDFETDKEMIDILNTLIYMNNLNILFIGDIGSGKTSYLKSVIREYYKDCNPTYQEMNENILEINSLKEQGIHFYRTDVKTFCQTQSSIKAKKKIVMLDDIDLINEQSQQVFRNCIDKYSHNVSFYCFMYQYSKSDRQFAIKTNYIEDKSNKFNLHAKNFE